MQNIVSLSDVLSPTDAARVLRHLGLDIGASAVKWNADNGNIPFSRTAGGMRIFHRKDIEAFAAARARQDRKKVVSV